MIGQTLKDRYEITAAIGKGAMGEVYRATDKQTGADVAVKLMAGQLAFDPDMVERFRREGEALRQLRHPNIVGLVDTFLHENRPASVGGQAGGDALTMVDTFPRESRQAIVLEYVPGGSLHSLLKREAPLDITRVKQIALDLCDALIRAHRLNIVHRDIKPENVLMADDGTPRLTDFGVARLVGGATRLTGTGTQIGTPYYMSPEAWEGEQADAQSDIWSLGIMLYEMLSGHVPFGGETMAAVMNKVLTAPLPDLRSVRPEAPDGLVQIIERMVTRDRVARYQSMREVAADLERGHPLEAPTAAKNTRPAAMPNAAEATKVERIDAAPGRARLPGWAWGAGVALLVLIVGGVLFATGVIALPGSRVATSALPTLPPVLQSTATHRPPVSFITEGALESVLFEDSFDDEPSPRWDFQPGRWQTATVDGRTVLLSDTSQSSTFVNLEGEGWTDYAAQFDFKFLKPDEHNAYYFFLRVRATNCPPTVEAMDDYVTFITTEFVELHEESCEAHMQEAVAQNDRNIDPESWHTAQAIAIGNRVRLLIDGEEFFNYTDSESPFLDGGVGLFLQNKVELAIDNFRVNEIILGESAPAATAAPVTP